MSGLSSLLARIGSAASSASGDAAKALAKAAPEAGKRLIVPVLGAAGGYGIGGEMNRFFPDAPDESKENTKALSAMVGLLMGTRRGRNFLFSKSYTRHLPYESGKLPAGLAKWETPAAVGERLSKSKALANGLFAFPTAAMAAHWGPDVMSRIVNGQQVMNSPKVTDFMNRAAVEGPGALAEQGVQRIVDKSVMPQAKAMMENRVIPEAKDIGKLLAEGIGGQVGGGALGYLAGGAGSDFLANQLYRDNENLPYEKRKSRDRSRESIGTLGRLLGVIGGGVGGGIGFPLAKAKLGLLS